MQTFVYLFAPICQNIRETDFDQNMRLINGRKIWSAMWEYRHPDVETFTAQVKPRQTIVKDLRKKISKNTGDDVGIFMGECKYNLSHFTAIFAAYNTKYISYLFRTKSLSQFLVLKLS